jgi:hypothetical protein
MGNSCVAVKLVPSHEGTCSIDLVNLLLKNESLKSQKISESLQK